MDIRYDQGLFASGSDQPMPLRDDTEVFLQYNPASHVYESIHPGFFVPPAVGAEPFYDNRRVVVPPPVPPRVRLPSASVACRRAPVAQRQTSFAIPESRQPFTRSHTQVTDPDPWAITLIDSPEGSTQCLRSFCVATTRWRSKYKHTDPIENSGVVWSRVSHIHRALLQQVEVTVSVVTQWHPDPLPFPTSVDITVKSLIDKTFQLLDIAGNTKEQFLFKLCASEECLRNEELLGMHEAIQSYCKFKLVVPLRLVNVNDMRRQSRDAADDNAAFHLHELLRPIRFASVSKFNLQDLLDSFHREVTELMRSQCGRNVSMLVSCVHRISNLLCGFTCAELENAIGMINRIGPLALSPDKMSECATAVTMLHSALSTVLQIYFDNFESDFRSQNLTGNPQIYTVADNRDILQFNMAAIYNLQTSWKSTYETFSVSCELTYGDAIIFKNIAAENISTILSSGNKILCNRMMVFPVPVNKLPYETMLTFRLRGTKRNKGPELLCWAAVPLYHDKFLVKGTVLLNLTTLTELPHPSSAALYESNRLVSGTILQLDFPDQVQWQYQRPVGLQESIMFSQPCEELQEKMSDVFKKHCICFLSDNEKSLLWDKRYSCDRGGTCLHLLLASAPWWEPEVLTEIYTLVDNWLIYQPEEALFLLGHSVHDQNVRRAAVQYFELIPAGELEVFLPQLVQALKSEWSLKGPLVTMLLGRSLTSIRIAQQLYWLLEDVFTDPHYQSWFSKVQAALRYCCGRALREELEHETRLVQVLMQVAEKVRTADKMRRQNVLKAEKGKIDQFFKDGISCSLPLDPAFRVKAVNLHTCKFFNSNAAPLAISFVCTDPLASDISVICKTGDDLSQDMLVLQIIRVMDRVWLQEGLDLQMITYRCLSTGKTQGLVEMVPDSVTLAKIQQEWGLGGTLREDTLEKWFHNRNKTKDDYEKAVTNFILSCAGWCVATFILGICDRHNDNIMLKHSGHMFHIDFGKIMGNAQKIGAVKRDRSPFIFTSEMYNFITGGGRDTQRLHRFVELCCKAYNIIRKRSALILSLLELMLHAGMPELKDTNDLQYVQNNLNPYLTDMEATSYFTMKIKESMKCTSVKFNFLVHAMAQISKQGSASLHGDASAPNTNIQEAFIEGYALKVKEPVFQLIIKIDDGYVRSEKTFSQFELMHKQLQKHFIENTLPQFPTRFVMTSTPERKMQRLNKYLKQLFERQCKGNEFVCSLFLDGPTDDQESLTAGTFPEIQLYISYSNSKLSVLVKHLKNLKLANGLNPDAYVVTRLKPELYQKSKRKTKVVPNNNNPTFNELLEYKNVPQLYGMVLEVQVKSNKNFLVATNIKLEDKLLFQETWFPLRNRFL